MAYRYVYFAKKRALRPTQQFPKSIKIGLSRNPAQRMAALQCDLIFAVRCEWRFARTLERVLHQEFDYAREAWQPWEGGTEYFRVDERLRLLVSCVLELGYWPWTGEPVIRRTDLPTKEKVA